MQNRVLNFSASRGQRDPAVGAQTPRDNHSNSHASRAEASQDVVIPNDARYHTKTREVKWEWNGATTNQDLMKKVKDLQAHPSTTTGWRETPEAQHDQARASGTKGLGFNYKTCTTRNANAREPIRFQRSSQDGAPACTTTTEVTREQPPNVKRPATQRTPQANAKKQKTEANQHPEPPEPEPTHPPATWMWPTWEDDEFKWTGLTRHTTTSDQGSEIRIYAAKDTEIPAGTHIVIGGLPIATDTAYEQVNTEEGTRIFFLRDTNGNDILTNQRATAMACYGTDAIKGGPECKGADIAFYLAQADAPNCCYGHNSIVTMKDIRPGDEMTIGFNRSIGTRAWKKTRQTAPGYPLLDYAAAAAEPFPTATREEATQKCKILLAAILSMTGAPEAHDETRTNALTEAIRLGIIPSVITSTTLTPEREVHSSLQFAAHFNSINYNESASKHTHEEGRRQLKQLLHDKDHENADHELNFKIFEAMMKRVDGNDGPRCKFQKIVIPLGRAAGAESFDYLRRYIDILTNTLAITADKSGGKDITNSIANHLKETASKHGVVAYAHFAKWIDVETNRQLLLGMPDIAKAHINGLIQKMTAALNQLPLSHDKWIEACRTPPQGFVDTDTTTGTQIYQAPGTQPPPDHITMAAWNVNGLVRLLHSGMFAAFLRNALPDVLSLTEVKTDPGTFRALQEFYWGLAALGYRHAAWNWSTATSTEFGTLVISKYHLDNIQFGLSDNGVDKEGRCITITMRGCTFILPYVPCGRLGKEDGRRARFDDDMRTHLTRTRISNPDGCIVIAGDLNVTISDHDVRIHATTRPLTRFYEMVDTERQRHLAFMRDFELRSAGVQLQGHSETDQNTTWAGHIPDDNGARHTTLDHLRLDDVLTTRVGHHETEQLPAVTGMWTCPSYYGSDHKAIVYYFSFTGQPPPDTWETGLQAGVPTPPKDGPTRRKTNKEPHTAATTGPARTVPSMSTTTTQQSQLTSWTKDIAAQLKKQIEKFEGDTRLRAQATQVAKDIEKHGRTKPGYAAKCCAAGHNGQTINENSDYTAYNDEGRLKPHRVVVPEVDWNLQDNQGLWQQHKTLVDSGAHFNIMSLDTAMKLGTHPRTVDNQNQQLQLPMLILTDRSIAKVAGVVNVNMQFADGTVDDVEFFVLQNSSYPVIIGSEYFVHTRANIDYKSRRVRFTIKNVNTYVNYNRVIDDDSYTTLATTVSLKGNVLVPAGATNMRVPVIWDTTPDTARFGLLEDTQLHAVHCAAIMCHTSAATEEKNFAVVSNHSSRDVTLKPGRPLLSFHAIDENDTDVFDASIFDVEEAPDHVENPTPQCATASQTACNSDTEWKQYPQLHQIEINENLEADVRNLARNMLIKHRELWDPVPKGPSPEIEPYRIKLDSEFTAARSRPINPLQRKALKAMVDQQLAKHVIEPSTSRFSSPVVLVPKKGGKLRFALNYTRLNDCIADDKYTAPNVDTALSCLHGNTHFTTLDLTDAYWSVPLADESKELTAFQTPDGLFQYRALPQGMKTSGAAFCRRIDHMVGALKWVHVLVYVDDLLIFGKTATEHLNVLDKVLGRLNQFRMTLSPTKCHVLMSSVKYLGHIVDTDGIRCDTDKVKALTEIKVPQNTHDMRVALGKIRYYRKFIRDYAEIEKPLRLKLGDAASWTKGGDGEVVYTTDETQAFNVLVKALCEEPILGHPDWSQPFVLHTDACKKGLGASLLQMIDNKEHVVSYASRSLTTAEANYNVWELECLAMVWATRLHRMYLLGSKFKIVTDSNAAKHVMKLNDDTASGRLMRWSLALQDFSFDIEHRKGKRHTNVDALSRLPLASTEPYREGPTTIEPATMLDDPRLSEPFALNSHGNEGTTGTDPIDNKAFFPPCDKEATTLTEFVQIQKDDEYCQQRLTKANKTRTSRKTRGQPDKPPKTFTNGKGLLCQRAKGGTGVQIITPVALRAFILRRYHGLPVSGHLGRNKVLKQIIRHYYWPHMKADLKRWIDACLTCARRKRTRNMHAGDPGVVSNATRPWETIAIDVVTPSKTSKEGYTKILTVLDLFSRWVLALPMRKADAQHVSNALFRHVFCMFGKPKRIHSDEGSEFINKTIKLLAKVWDIHLTGTGGYQPQANPVERYHRFMGHTMTMLCTAYGDDWPSYLPAAVFTYNSSTCESTGFSPYELVFCGMPATLLHELDLKEATNEPTNTAAFRQESHNRLHEAYISTRIAQEKMAAKNRAATIARQGPKQAQRAKYEAGDQVMFWEPQQSKKMQTTQQQQQGTEPVKRPAKWQPKWTGPHLITSKDPHDTGFEYTFFHQEKAKHIKTVANKLDLFRPWSEGITSSSWRNDYKRRFRTGEWVTQGTTVLVPLKPPVPFGIAFVLNSNQEGDLLLQWLGNPNENPNDVFQKGWKAGDGKTYYASTPRKLEDEPYTTKHDDITLNQRDILIHDFKLTPSDKLPKAMLRVIAEHPDVWWSPNTTKKQADITSSSTENKAEGPQGNAEPNPGSTDTNEEPEEGRNKPANMELSSDDETSSEDSDDDQEIQPPPAEEENTRRGARVRQPADRWRTRDDTSEMRAMNTAMSSTMEKQDEV